MSVPVIAVRGLVRRFEGRAVLDGLDLDVAPGEVVAVRGASGTGKSTLLHLVGLLDRPDAGSVALDGTEVAVLPERQRRRWRSRSIGFVFQAYHLMPEFSVLENVLMAARAAGHGAGAWRERAADLLGRLGLSAQVRRLPATLSGGERQRVAVARAILLRPRIVLADEPTGNLDPATAMQVLDELLVLARASGSAVLLVTHDDAVSQRADRTVRLVAGRIDPAG